MVVLCQRVFGPCLRGGGPRSRSADPSVPRRLLQRPRPPASLCIHPAPPGPPLAPLPVRKPSYAGQGQRSCTEPHVSPLVPGLWTPDFFTRWLNSLHSGSPVALGGLRAPIPGVEIPNPRPSVPSVTGRRVVSSFVQRFHSPRRVCGLTGRRSQQSLPEPVLTEMSPAQRAPPHP